MKQRIAHILIGFCKLLEMSNMTGWCNQIGVTAVTSGQPVSGRNVPPIAGKGKGYHPKFSREENGLKAGKEGVL
jgi:hypothetical protein